MSQRFVFAVRAARAAGKILADKLSAQREIKSKGKRDIVTDADFAADRIIRKILLTQFSNDRFLSEEGDASERAALWAFGDRTEDGALWIVDPLDGTTNYSRNLTPFTTSIAMYRAGAVEIGVVYDPVRDEMFAAERGRGAWLNNKLIHVSNVRKFEDAVIGAEWSRLISVRRRSTQVFGKMLERAMTGRAFGSAAHSLCVLAAGRMEGYMHLSLAPWDIAAAALIVEEAGGRVTDPAGAAWSVHSKSYIASNGHLHRTMLGFFK
jgi:myo-inositol-1(or 4)-monophosphatase